jgi:hypothetical protein
MAVGAATFLGGVGRLDAVQQDWDAPYHGNLIRWIVETGNPLPSTLAPLANLPQGVPYFYPDTYHALLALLLDRAAWRCRSCSTVPRWPSSSPGPSPSPRSGWRGGCRRWGRPSPHS